MYTTIGSAIFLDDTGAMDKSITTIFGSYILKFTCNQQSTLDLLYSHFRDCLSDKEPDISILMTVVSPDKITTVKEVSESRYAYLDDKTVNFGPNLIEGRWDFQNNIFKFTVSQSLMVQEELWLFDRFLCSLYYTLVMNDTNRNHCPFIVHSSGVIRDGRGYIYFGPPESGKSTIASLSRKFTVIHDDMNIVTLDGKSVMIEGVPFNPKLINRTNEKAPLSMICSLHKSDTVKLERGSADEFTRKALAEIFLPMPLFSNDRNSAFNYLLACVKELSQRVPYYRLYFKKDDNFWECIEKEEDKNGKH
jgi:hypothetical protein